MHEKTVNAAHDRQPEINASKRGKFSETAFKFTGREQGSVSKKISSQIERKRVQQGASEKMSEGVAA